MNNDTPPSVLSRLGNSCHGPAFVAILFWAISYPLTRLCLEHFSPQNLAFLRFAIASVVLIGYAARKGIHLPPRRDWPLFCASGVCGFFLYMTLFCTGCLTVTSATSAVVIAVTPVATAFLARLVFGEKLAWIKWVAIAVEFVGILLLTLLDGVLSINIGVVYLAVAAFVLAGYNLMQRRLTKTYSPLDATLYSMVTGTLMLAVFLPGSVREAVTAPPDLLVYVAIMGIIPSAVAYVLWSRALGRAENTSTVSNYMFVTPFFAALLGFLIVGEIPDWGTLIGGGVIMFGLGLFTFGERLLRR